MDVGAQEMGLAEPGRGFLWTKSAATSPDFDLNLQAKTKQIQIKRLAFPWIPLAESGLFNGLRRIQIKKNLFLGNLSPTALN
jgi:hypothetical protein